MRAWRWRPRLTCTCSKSSRDQREGLTRAVTAGGETKNGKSEEQRKEPCHSEEGARVAEPLVRNREEPMQHANQARAIRSPKH